MSSPLHESSPVEDTVVDTEDSGDAETPEEEDGVLDKLYKSSRMKGYVTLVLTSIVNYDAAQRSDTVLSAVAIPASLTQRRYAVAVSSVSMGVSAFLLLAHLDRFTPLHKFWVKLFAKGSRFELFTSLCFVLWWSIGTGIQTSVTGIAGDGKGHFSLYFSSWACTMTSYWIVERWWVEAGVPSFKSFISSWPNRAPGWIAIFMVDSLTLVWFWDLWNNHDNLNRDSEKQLRLQFDLVPEWQWAFLLTISALTMVPSVAFVLVELCRETKASEVDETDGDDGTSNDTEKKEVVVGKGRMENYIEGVSICLLFMAWVPCIMVATTPGGPAALVGNAYFFSWTLVIFITETAVWYIHDLRQNIHESLERKKEAYRKRQFHVMRQTEDIQRKELMRQEREEQALSGDSERAPSSRFRVSTAFFDARDAVDE